MENNKLKKCSKAVRIILLIFAIISIVAAVSTLISTIVILTTTLYDEIVNIINTEMPEYADFMAALTKNNVASILALSTISSSAGAVVLMFAKNVFKAIEMNENCFNDDAIKALNLLWKVILIVTAVVFVAEIIITAVIGEASTTDSSIILELILALIVRTFELVFIKGNKLNSFAENAQSDVVIE